MASSVLDIGNAAAEIAGLPQQTNLIGNTEQNAKKILRSVKDAAQKDAFRDVDWSILQTEHAFTTDASTSYDLPTDFDRIINETVWDRTNDLRLIGPSTALEWQRYESGITGLTGLTKVIRIVGVSGTKKIKIYPSTDTGSSLAFEYISNKFILTGGITLVSEIQTDNDTFLFDDDIIEASATYRLLRLIGMSYADEREDYNDLISERSSNDAGAQRINMASNPILLLPNVPETGYGT